MRRLGLIVPFLALAALVAPVGASHAPRVALVSTPGAGIQPQAVMDGQGTLHLVCLKGDPGAGDIFYVRRPRGETGFSPPLRVNHRAGSAVAVGTIRGAQLAVGKGGRAHVVWFGSDRSEPGGDPARGAPLLYSRLNDAGTQFEPERNLMRVTSTLDGGPSVAADGSGNVYVAWHANDGPPKGEAERRIWVARSRDEGRSFAQEVPATDLPTGACACCSTRVFANRGGALYLLYRAATAGVERDMMLLTSRDRGETFRGDRIHPWRVNACPMSSESFAEGPAGVVAAWETRGQVFYARLDRATGTPAAPIPAPGAGEGRKHPTVAVDDRGNVLLAWTEGTGWQKGGSLAWQLFDAKDRPTSDKGLRTGAIPVWGLATAVADRQSGFTIFY